MAKRKNEALFLRGSLSTKFEFGKAIARTSPGNPAPVPTSRIFFGKDTKLIG